MAFKKLVVSVPKIYDSVMFPVKEYNAKKVVLTLSVLTWSTALCLMVWFLAIGTVAAEPQMLTAPNFKNLWFRKVSQSILSVLFLCPLAQPAFTVQLLTGNRTHACKYSGCSMAEHSLPALGERQHFPFSHLVPNPSSLISQKQFWKFQVRCSDGEKDSDIKKIYGYS